MWMLVNALEQSKQARIEIFLTVALPQGCRTTLIGIDSLNGQVIL